MKPMKSASAKTIFEELKRSAGSFGEKDQALLHCESALMRTGRIYEAFDEFVRTPNPKSSATDHRMAVEKKAGELWKKCEAELMSAKDHLKQRDIEMNHVIDALLGIVDANEKPFQATEVRQALKAMSKQERLACLHTAIEGNDTTVMGSVFSGHSFLSGLTQGQHRQYRQSAALKNAQSEMKLKGILKHADELCDMQLNRIAANVQGLTSKSINRLAEQADAASDKLKKAMA
jgi:hypothetical protein